MRVVDVALQRLHEVVDLQPLGYVAVLHRHHVPLEVRQGRSGFPGAHVRPYDPVPLLAGVRLDADLVLEGLALRSIGHVDARPGGVELPSMVDAPESVLLVASEEHARATVGTAVVDHADVSGGVPVGDEVLAKQPHAERLAVAFG